MPSVARRVPATRCRSRRRQGLHLPGQPPHQDLPEHGDSRDHCERALGDDEMGEHEPLALAFAGPNVLVAACRQAMSNSEDMHVVFVLVPGQATPVLAVPSQKALEKFDWDEGWTNGVTVWAIAPTGSLLATWWTGEGLALYDVRTRKRTKVLRKHDADEDISVLALAFEADAKRLAVLVDGGLEVYDCASGKRIFREDIAETFGESQLSFAGATVTWTRNAPGLTDERRSFVIP